MPASSHTTRVDYALVTPRCLPASNQVSIYADFGYAGVCRTLDIGEYPVPSGLNPVGNDNAESIMVGSDVQSDTMGTR